MTKKQEHKHCTPEQLYLKMLEIGSECISCGTNLKKIKSELSNCGYISSEEDDTTLKIIFQNSFTHDNTNQYYVNYCNAPEPKFECNPVNKEEYERLQELSENYDHEHECTWFLTPEALMNLLRLKEAEKNRTTSRNTKLLSFASLGAALLILASNLIKPDFTEILETTEFIELSENISRLDSNISELPTYLQKLDSVHQVNDSFQNENFIEKTKIVEINETLKSLNWKLLQIKREIENK